MHEALAQVVTLIADPSITPSSDGGHTIAVTLIITAGTVVSGAFGLIVASLQRGRTPATSPALSPDATALMDRLQHDLTETEEELTTVRHRHGLLRRAVHHRGLDPDVLIAQEEAME